jgi:hypothetical protein
MSDWKITIPIVRAFEREDGKWILVGEASGPEQDTHKTRMLPEAIVDFAAQIKTAVEQGNPLPYIDSHLTRGSAVQLGWVLDGWVTEDWHLHTEVELDQLNPISRYIFESITQQGKQWGQSIAGTVDRKDVVMKRLDGGEKDVAFKRVALKEISNTSSPSWTHSLGTVLVRSLDGEVGDLEMSETLEVSASIETVIEEITEETAERESEQPETEGQPDETLTTREEDEEEPEGEPESVERARLSAKDKAALIEQYQNLGSLLSNLGVLDAEDANETTPETTEKSVSDTGMDQEMVTRIVSIAVEQAIEPLKAHIEKQAEYIEALEKMPAGKMPPGVTREKFAEDVERLGETPQERMRNALSVLYQDR